MALDTPYKRCRALRILTWTWESIGIKGEYFEFHYNELRKLVKEYL